MLLGCLLLRLVVCLYLFWERYFWWLSLGEWVFAGRDVGRPQVAASPMLKSDWSAWRLSYRVIISPTSIVLQGARWSRQFDVRWIRLCAIKNRCVVCYGSPYHKWCDFWIRRGTLTAIGRCPSIFINIGARRHVLLRTWWIALTFSCTCKSDY